MTSTPVPDVSHEKSSAFRRLLGSKRLSGRAKGAGGLPQTHRRTVLCNSGDTLARGHIFRHITPVFDKLAWKLAPNAFENIELTAVSRLRGSTNDFWLPRIVVRRPTDQGVRLPSASRIMSKYRIARSEFAPVP